MDAFAGIDVATAKRKRLPVSLCVRDERGVIPLPVAASAAPNPPRGRGNAATLNENVVANFADEVAEYLRRLEIYFAVTTLYIISAFAVNRIMAFIEHRVRVPGTVGAAK